jgi:hypothetical protein
LARRSFGEAAGALAGVSQADQAATAASQLGRLMAMTEIGAPRRSRAAPDRPG